MHFTSNVSHWVCLLAGLYLVVTGIVLHGSMDEPIPAGVRSPRRALLWRRMLSLGRRTVMIVVGLAAMAYGLMRMLT